MIPMMISRLVISLRKTVDGSLVQVWDEDHFTAVESGVHEMMDFAGPSSSQTPLSPISRRDSKRSSVRPDLAGPRSEA